MRPNLEQHRSGLSVWEGGCPSTSDHERWAAALAAGALFLAAARRRSGAGLLMAAVGGVLTWWATSTPDTRSYRKGQLKAVLSYRDKNGDPVSEASEESFPASDAPSWTSGPNTTDRPSH